MATAKKAIYVDGPWLYARREIFGFSRISFATLKTILTLEVGSRLPIHEFAMTLKGGIGELARSVGRVGIEPILVDQDRDQDEEVLIQRIWALPPEVQEILVVTGDIDFHPVLIEKASQNARISILGTRRVSRDGRCSTARVFFQPPYRFVDLAEFAPRLEYGMYPQEEEPRESFLDQAPENLPETPVSSANVLPFPGAGQIVHAAPEGDRYRLAVEFTGSQNEIQKIIAKLANERLLIHSDVRVALQTEELA